MRKISTLISSFLLIGLSITSYGSDTTTYKYDYETVESDPLNTLIYTLDNGLKVYISVNKDEPRIQTNIAVNVGSKQDPTDATGLAHYLEHMVFKGTSGIATINWEEEKKLLQKISDLYEKRRSVNEEDERRKIYHQIDSISGVAAQYAVANEYDKMMSSIGAKGTNAYTSFERTVYVNDIPSNEIEKWLALESERFNELVLRIFHTELEAVYEEFNGGQDNDQRLSFYALMENLFKKHTYGTQTTIGTSEHLKNPSMVKIHEFFNTYYVPNNMAIVLSGDVDPDKTIDLIKKYFGKYQSKEIPEYTFEPEDEITEVESIAVQGSQSEWIDIGYRLPGIKNEDTYILQLMDGLLANGQAGLIDLNLVKGQKILNGYSNYNVLKDYSVFQLHANPREGQSLDEAKDLLFAELEKIKNGEFEDWMLSALIKNFKLNDMRSNEHNSSRVSKMSNAFIMEQKWSDVVTKYDKLSTVTKKDVVAFANKYLNDSNYVVVYKRNGESKNTKVEKPAITELVLNKDTASLFGAQFEKMESGRLTPVFDDYEMGIQKDKLNNNTSLYYVKNTINEMFSLNYILDMGSYSDKEMALAVRYLKYLGTDKYSANELQMEMYKLGLSYNVSASPERLYVSLSGLEESLEEGIQLFESILANVQPDQEAYNNMVAGILKQRNDSKLSKGSILRVAMTNHAIYGDDSPFKHRLNEDELKNMDINVLISKIKELTSYQHYVYYYGKKDMDEVKKIIETHHKTPDQLKPLIEAKKFSQLETTQNKVYFVNYNMVQAEILMFSKKENYNKNIAAPIKLFNGYFGSGLSSIVFQEIRESKALAYSAYSAYSIPNKLDKSHYIQSYVGTQADKLNSATTALLELMNNMPEINNQFEDAKLATLKKIESSRTKPSSLFWKYLAAKDLKIDYDINKDVYPQIKEMELKDLKAFFNQNVKNKKYTFLVIGNKDLIDKKALTVLGNYKELTLEELFGY